MINRLLKMNQTQRLNRRMSKARLETETRQTQGARPGSHAWHLISLCWSLLFASIGVVFLSVDQQSVSKAACLRLHGGQLVDIQQKFSTFFYYGEALLCLTLPPVVTRSTMADNNLKSSLCLLLYIPFWPLMLSSSYCFRRPFF